MPRGRRTIVTPGELDIYRRNINAFVAGGRRLLSRDELARLLPPVDALCPSQPEARAVLVRALRVAGVTVNGEAIA